jgi:hypothetical protein
MKPPLLVPALGLFLAAVAAAQTAPPAAPPAPETRAERTRFAETSRYDDVMAFLREVDRRSPLVHLTTFGYSYEGRPLPLAVVGRVKDASAAAVRATGLTRVYVQGNIHAGEVEGKEVLQMLLRDLAAGRHPEWTSSMVLLVAPIYNADGNERVRLDQRTLQNGPLGGVGQRPNAQDLDLNRDHMKLDSPEARSLAGLLRDYDPHLGIDLHTTNGTYHAYQLTYATPLHPNTSANLTGWLRKDWLPVITRRIKTRDGWDFYYYGNLPGPAVSASGGAPLVSARERAWYSFDHRPRFNNNYLGLRNRLAILSEAYAYLPFDERVAVTRRFVEEILTFAHANAARIREVVADADRERLAGRTLALSAELARSSDGVDILLGGVDRVTHPLTGKEMLRRTDERRVERMPEYGVFAPTATAVVPRAYLVPPSLARLVELLAAHGVRTAPLERDAEMDVERFVVTATRLAERPFQGHRERTVQGAWKASRETVPAGTLVVAMDQPLARLAFTLLEPQSDDGAVNWNVLDGVFEPAGQAVALPLPLPIVRTHAPIEIRPPNRPDR